MDRYIIKEIVEIGNGDLQFNNGNVIKYIYSATGEKLRTIHYTAPANIHVDVECDYEDIEHNYLAVDSTDYLCGGSVIYVNAIPSKIFFDGGYIDVSYVKRNAQRPRRTSGMTDEEYLAILERWRAYIAERTTLGYRFYNKDHLGNIREVIDEDGVVCQKSDYYPFGTPFSTETYAITSGFQPFKYNGKEFDMMHGLNTYDYGARQYYPLFAQWDRVDPLCEKYYHVSPYAYCLNNPVKYLDPNGEEPTEEEAARIAAHVYGDQNDDILIGNWRVSSREFGISNNYGLKSQVYERVNKAGKVLEYVYATAGTEKKDIKDWVADITQVVGASKQYHVSATNAQKISDELNKEGSELNYVGHSLGGGEAALNSLLTYGEGKGRRAFTFNAAGVSLATKIKEGGLSIPFKSERSIKAHITLTDPLNIIQNGNKLLPSVNGNRTYVIPKRINGHDIENFY